MSDAGNDARRQCQEQGQPPRDKQVQLIKMGQWCKTGPDKQFPSPLAHDAEVGASATIYAGDKTYEDADLPVRRWAAGKHSLSTPNDYRRAATNEHRDAWERLKELSNTLPVCCICRCVPND